MTRPNVLFILTDQQRYDALSCRGGSPARTPNMDRLASGGTRFEHAYVQCPLCVPSRLSLLTGQYTHTHRTIINEHPEDESIPTWAEVLADAGYQTVAVGKTHGIHRGFKRIGPAYKGAYDCGSGGAKWPHGLTVESTDRPREEHFDFLSAEQAVEQMRIMSANDAPWAMHLGIFSPHPPYIMPKPFDTMFDPDDMVLPPFERSELDSKTRGQRNMHDRHFDVPDEKLRRMMAGYWSCVALADACVGRVLDALEELGIADNTLVVLVSDHGDLNAEHGLFSKFSSAYDAEMRVPLVLRWPGHIEEGQVNTELVESIDVVPTILEACGCEVPTQNQGRSLWPMLRGETQAHREYVTALTGWHMFADLRPYGHMIRTKTHKLVFYPDDTCELYDMEADPGERVNLYEDAAYAEVRHSLERLLLAETIRTQRPGP
jgi:arylsulfatase